jgi:hypothetical protein
MPSRRTPIDRQRNPVINAEMVAEFVALENTPKRQRKSEEFWRKDKELHNRLGLGFERIAAVVSVLDPGPHPYPPGSPHYEGAERVKAARRRLLALAGLDEPASKRAS